MHNTVLLMSGDNDKSAPTLMVTFDNETMLSSYIMLQQLMDVAAKLIPAILLIVFVQVPRWLASNYIQLADALASSLSASLDGASCV